MTRIRPAIICGGSCPPLTRASRANLPKQFIPLIGERSSFQSIITIVGDRTVFDEPIVVTNFNYRFAIAEQLKEIGAEATILLEPEPRYSAAAVGVAAAWAAARNPKTVVAALAADHVFKEGVKFAECCVEAGAAAAAGEIVAFGVTPDHPATAYGYIRPAEPLAINPKIRRVGRFVEKPDEAHARAFIEDGYMWNSGNFVFRADVMLGELERFEPEIAAAAREAVALARKDGGFVVLDRDAFLKAPKTSIDFAVMEKTRRAAVATADVGWSDVGQWSIIWQLDPQDADVAIASSKALRRPDAPSAAVAGLDNVVVVPAHGAAPAADQSEIDKVKDLVDRLKAEGYPETTRPPRVHRPWGYYLTVDRGPRFQVKRIVVRPGGRFSLQLHHHRSEHWVVVRGAAEVTLNGAARLVRENESVYVPIGAEHSLANVGKIDAELIEVQTGDYLGEDDIVRIEDGHKPT